MCANSNKYSTSYIKIYVRKWYRQMTTVQSKNIDIYINSKKRTCWACELKMMVKGVKLSLSR